MPAPAAPFNRFIVVYGGEDYLIDQQLHKARKSKRRVVRLDGAGMTDAALVEICETHDDDPRVVVVDNADEIKGDKELAAFFDRPAAGDRSLILVAAVRSSSLNKLWEKAAALGKKVECAKLKPYDDKAFLRFIDLEAGHNRVKIKPDVAAELFERVGPDLYLLANEIRKLAAYVGAAGTVTREQVQLLVGSLRPVDAFSVCDFVVQGDGPRALTRFEQLCMLESETAAMLSVLGALMRKYEQLVVIRYTIDQSNLNDNDVAERVGLNPWVYKNKWLPIARRLGIKALVERMARLCELDVYVKSGFVSKRTMFEFVLLELSSPGLLPV